MIGRRSVSTHTGTSSGVVTFALLLIFIWGVVPTAAALSASVVTIVAVKVAEILGERF